MLANGGHIVYAVADGALKGILGTFKNDGVKIARQAKASINDCTRLALAEYFVKNKIILQKNFIYNYNKKLHKTELEAACKELNYFESLAGRQDAVNKLLGIEGITTRIYFDCFKLMLEGSGFMWYGRNRRPPLDPVNAMLSFAYYLLEKELKPVIIAEGYHCGIGFLHSLTNTDDGFVYDVMELFRTSAVEKFVFKCINYGWIIPDDFILEGGKCLLTETGRNNFIARFEAYIHEKNFDGFALREAVLQKLAEINKYFKEDEKTAA